MLVLYTGVFNLHSGHNIESDWCRAKVLTSVSHLFLVLNSSTNIVIYCWKDDKFRLVLFRMLRLVRPMVHSPDTATTPILR